MSQFIPVRTIRMLFLLPLATAVLAGVQFSSPANANRAGGVGDVSPPPSEARTKEISFKLPIDFSTGAIPSSADFNVAHGDQMPLLITRATPLSAAVAVGDFNHDGKQDVAQTNVVAGTVSVFLGDGDGGFAPPQQHPVGVNPVFVVAGDLELDGRLDLAVANYGSNNVALLRGDGKGSFQPALFVAVPAPRHVAIGNFNGDGLPDLAVASSGRAVGSIASPIGGVSILAGSEAGSFTPVQVMTPSANGRPVGANHVAVADFDGSGFDDLAVGVGTTTNAGDLRAGDTQPIGDDVLVFLNRNRPLDSGPEEPFTTPTEQQRIRVGGIPNAIAVADLNGDTHPDLAVLGGGSGDITTLLGDSQGRFVVKATNVTVGALPFSLEAGDFDDDGFVDLVTANWSSSTVSVLQGNGNGTFQPAVDFWSGDATTSAAVADFDRDGRVDVVAGRLRNDHLALLLNESPERGDGVVIERDIPYFGPTHFANDPLAAHHTLDVYSPPKGTASFTGRGQPYPVVLFAHGGFGIIGDKSMVSYLMRSLALDGIVAISIDYRLSSNLVPGSPQNHSVEDQIKDFAQAFRWTRDNVGSREDGGDPNRIFVAGTSAGANLVSKFATEAGFVAEQKSIGALVLLGSPNATPGNSPTHPPSLLLNGDEGGEISLIHNSVAFSTESQRRRADSMHVVVPGRDHLTLVSDLALAGDPGRVLVLDFMRSHLVATAGA